MITNWLVLESQVTKHQVNVKLMLVLGNIMRFVTQSGHTRHLSHKPSKTDAVTQNFPEV